MGSVDPFRITVEEERHAVPLAQELIGLSDVDLQRDLQGRMRTDEPRLGTGQVDHRPPTRSGGSGRAKTSSSSRSRASTTSTRLQRCRRSFVA
jgi:hypothetical protein